MAEHARFEPRFTLILVYFFVFVVAWGLVLAAPDIAAGLRDLPPGADPTQAGRETVRKALEGRIPMAVGAAVVSLGALLWLRVLPGLRPRRPPA
jgi:hypothetical protein